MQTFNLNVCIFYHNIQPSTYCFFSLPFCLFFFPFQSTCATYQEIHGVSAQMYTKISLLIPTEDIKYF